MDSGRSKSSPPLRKRTKGPDGVITRRPETSGGLRQLLTGAPKFELLGHHRGEKDEPVMLVNEFAMGRRGNVRFGGITRGTAHSSNPRSRPTSANYPPNTTYRRVTLKPHPYDNTTMLRDAHKNKPAHTRVFRELDFPSHFYQPTGQRQVGVGPGSRGMGLSNTVTRSLFHTDSFQSNTIQMLYQSSIAPFRPSQTSFRSVDLNQVALNFSSDSSIQPLPSHKGKSDQRRGQDQEDSSTASELSDAEVLRSRLRDLRPWEYTTLGKLAGDGLDEHAQSFVGGGSRFTLLSYNVLAQTHLENHRYLYSGCVNGCLAWSERFQLLLSEIRDFSPSIVCLQEVEETEFHQTFTPALASSGYRGVFKKRTGDKADGCAIFWNKDMFSLVAKLAVDLRQPHVPLLDRDNVALMVKLESKTGRYKQRLVVANTHLLFNPKRTDVKLAQVQLLLAELDRFSFSGFGRGGENVYLPILFCGDFNTEPHSTVSNLITDGSLRYLDANGHLPKALEKRGVIEFLPAYVGISDQCQHYRIQLERVKHWKSVRRDRMGLDRSTQLALINVHSEDGRPTSAASSSPSLEKHDNLSAATNNRREGSFDPQEHESVLSELEEFEIPCSFGSGILSHDLKFRSVYGHKLDRKSDGENVATTKQAAWTCVDFIFQGMQWNPVEGRRVEGNLKLIRRLRLLTRTQCKEVGQIPSLASPSDHYPLLAEFLLK